MNAHPRVATRAFCKSRAPAGVSVTLHARQVNAGLGGNSPRNAWGFQGQDLRVRGGIAIR